MAGSNTRSDLLWVLNDGGSPAALHAVGLDGADLGRVLLPEIRNVDWEDLATFERDDRSWLLIADVGDNFAMRHHVTLYVVAEPDARAKLALAADGHGFFAGRTHGRNPDLQSGLSVSP